MTNKEKDKQLFVNRLPSKFIRLARLLSRYQFTMKAQAHTKRIAELIHLAKQEFGDFSEVKKHEIFLCIKEAKTRGLLRKQPRDRCLSEYINAANYLLRVQPTDEFERA